MSEDFAYVPATSDGRTVVNYSHPEPRELAVEGLRVGDVLELEGGRVEVTRAAWGEPTGTHEIGYPDRTVHVYGASLGAGTALQRARHLSWPSGTLVLVLRP